MITERKGIFIWLTMIDSRKRAEKAGIYGILGTFSTLISVYFARWEVLRWADM